MYILFGALSFLVIRLLSLPGTGPGSLEDLYVGNLSSAFRQGEGGELISCLFFLNCFQLKIGLMIEASCISDL